MSQIENEETSCKTPKEEARCKICQNTEDNKIFIAREMMFGSQKKFPYFECSKCGCIQIAEIPTDISTYYPRSYYSLAEFSKKSTIHDMKTLIEDVLGRKRIEYAVFRRGTLGRIIFTIFSDYAPSSLSRLNLTKNSRILDVGCGSGTLLRSLMQIGFRNLHGIDWFIERDIHYRNGLQIEKKQLKEIEGEWDLIMFNHSLEHMGDHQTMLTIAAKLLSQSGVCLINMPIASSYAWRTYGTNWIQLDAPRHIFIHSITSLQIVAETAHMQLKAISYNSTGFQFWGSEQYMKGIPLHSRQSRTENPIHVIFSFPRLLRLSNRAKRLNADREGDQAAFYLIKKS